LADFIIAFLQPSHSGKQMTTAPHDQNAQWWYWLDDTLHNWLDDTLHNNGGRRSQTEGTPAEDAVDGVKEDMRSFGMSWEDSKFKTSGEDNGGATS